MTLFDVRTYIHGLYLRKASFSARYRLSSILLPHSIVLSEILSVSELQVLLANDPHVPGPSSYNAVLMKRQSSLGAEWSKLGVHIPDSGNQLQDRLHTR